MIDRMKKHKILFALICLAVLLLLIGVPFIINTLFKLNANADIFVAE